MDVTEARIVCQISDFHTALNKRMQLVQWHIQLSLLEWKSFDCLKQQYKTDETTLCE